MADPKAMLTTQQFAEKAGVSTSTISKWLRTGKVKGTKQGGKWMISEDQLPKSLPSPKAAETLKAAPVEKKAAPAPQKEAAAPAHKKGAKSYSVEAFSDMTYLTPFGVVSYLKSGKLSGSKDGAGKWEVDASNLESKEIKHLIR